MNIAKRVSNPLARVRLEGQTTVVAGYSCAEAGSAATCRGAPVDWREGREA
ncbi:hypothetical protein ACMHYB_44520 [Sorangium sp. So ce1128]